MVEPRGGTWIATGYELSFRTRFERHTLVALPVRFLSYACMIILKNEAMQYYTLLHIARAKMMQRVKAIGRNTCRLYGCRCSTWWQVAGHHGEA